VTVTFEQKTHKPKSSSAFLTSSTPSYADLWFRVWKLINYLNILTTGISMWCLWFLWFSESRKGNTDRRSMEQLYRAFKYLYFRKGCVFPYSKLSVARTSVNIFRGFIPQVLRSNIAYFYVPNNGTIYVFKRREQSPWEVNLLVTQLVKKFPAVYGTRRFITVFTRARHFTLSWAS
jgi:hypothetical protein